VKARLNYHDVVLIDEVHESMLFVDSSRPTARQDMSECFRLTNSIGGIAHRILKETVESLEHCVVVGLPIQVVLPTEGSED
jgi:hypothetical protein